MPVMNIPNNNPLPLGCQQGGFYLRQFGPFMFQKPYAQAKKQCGEEELCNQFAVFANKWDALFFKEAVEKGL